MAVGINFAKHRKVRSAQQARKQASKKNLSQQQAIFNLPFLYWTDYITANIFNSIWNNGSFDVFDTFKRLSLIDNR